MIVANDTIRAIAPTGTGSNPGVTCIGGFVNWALTRIPLIFLHRRCKRQNFTTKICFCKFVICLNKADKDWYWPVEMS